MSVAGAALVALALASGSLGATPKLAPLALSQTLRTSGEPFAIALDATGGRAYVSDSRENTLYVFDLATGEAIAFIPTGRQPNNVVLAAGKAYVSNFTDASISVIDTRTNEPLKTLAIGGLGLAASSATGRLYAAAGSRIWILDAATDGLVGTLDAPEGASLWGLAVDSAERLYATDVNNPRVLVYDGARADFIGSVAIDAPARFGITAAAGRVYVASFTDKSPQLSTIDGATRQVVGRSASAAFTNSLAVHPTTGLVYAASQRERSITAIEVTGRGAIAKGTLVPRTGGVAVHPLSGEPIIASAGGIAPPARAFVAPVPLVRP